jgi:hypothetical protein
MVLLEKLWDDVVAGPQPERGLGKLRKISAKPLNVQGVYIYICKYIIAKILSCLSIIKFAYAWCSTYNMWVVCAQC